MIYARNRNTNCVYDMKNRGDAVTSINNITPVALRPTADQRQVIIGVWAYRKFGGASSSPFYTVRIQTIGFVSLAELIMTPPVPGGEHSEYWDPMILMGGFGEALRLDFISNDDASEMILHTNFIII